MKKILFVCVFIMSWSLSAQTVYTTKTGEKYHKSTCHYLKYSKREITLNKALELGYMACSVCKPSSKPATSNSIIKSSTTNQNKAKKSTATQCTGITQAGKRCKRMTKNSNGKCYQH